MGWKLDKNKPICPQIEEQICAKIARGEFEPGQKLLSVRDIALEANVNPNTVQKALELLKSDGLIYPVGGSGWYVSDSTEHAKSVLERFLQEKTAAYFEEMEMLGYDIDKTKSYVKEWVK